MGWQHVAFVITDGYQRLYINGIEVAQSSYTAELLEPNPSNDLIDYTTIEATNLTTVGTHSDNQKLDYHFGGSIDNALIHSRPLSAAEILKLATSQPLAGETVVVPIEVLAVNDPPQLFTNNNVTSPAANTASFSEAAATAVVLHNTINVSDIEATISGCLLYTSPSPRDRG